MLQCVAVCCSVLQRVAVCCSVLQCVAVCCSMLQCVAARCSVLQCVAVCRSVLQCVAVSFILKYMHIDEAALVRSRAIWCIQYNARHYVREEVLR